MYVGFPCSVGIGEYTDPENKDWTGVAMLVPQAWLSIASLAPFRNVAYEFFKM